MNIKRCQEVIEQLAHLERIETGPAPEEVQYWLDGLGLPGGLLLLFKEKWLTSKCRFGYQCLYSCKEIRSDSETPPLLPFKLLHIGRMMNGELIVIDFSTDECVPALLSHIEWSPFDGSTGDARQAMEATGFSLDEFLEVGLQESLEIWDNHEKSKVAAAQRAPLSIKSSYTFDKKCEISSVGIPEGYELKVDYSPCTIRLNPDGSDAGMVVCLFSLRHEHVVEANEKRRGFREFPVGAHNWRLAIPEPGDEGLDSFMAILIRSDAAIAVYAGNFYWNEEDLRVFLSNVKPRGG